ncbi:KTSC domain-containing protein [Undibacterium sp. Ren11W]|uniref:KTSC domain-containing protein n=1 Tax=Undibacterium sp. Ren11W TaxID=3413045 RepID=UPI003BF1F890
MKRINAGKLRAIGYEARSRVLRVELDDGSAIEYAAVGPEVWRRLASSAAAWSFYRDNIEDEFTGRRGVAGKQARPAALDDLFKTPDADVDTDSQKG